MVLNLTQYQHSDGASPMPQMQRQRDGHHGCFSPPKSGRIVHIGPSCHQGHTVGLAYTQYQNEKGKPPSLVVLGNAVGNRIEIDYKTAKHHIEEIKTSTMMFCLIKLVSTVFMGE